MRLDLLVYQKLYRCCAALDSVSLVALGGLSPTGSSVFSVTLIDWCPSRDGDIVQGAGPSEQEFNGECIAPSVRMTVLDFCQRVQFLERSLIIANT